MIVSDSDFGVTPALDLASDDGDGLLSRGESWTFVATGTAADLINDTETVGLTVVQGCGNASDQAEELRETYENIGTVIVPGATDSDASHYCNPPAPNIESSRTSSTLVGPGTARNATSTARERSASDVMTDRPPMWVRVG